MAVRPSKIYLLGDYLLDPNKRVLTRAGAQVRLANRPFQLLLYLVENRERLVSRAELLELFWDGKDVYDDTLTKCVGAIRKALDDRLDNPRFIETRWAEGYRFIGPAEEQLADGDMTLPEMGRVQGVKIVIEEEEIQEIAPAVLKDSAPQLLAGPASVAGNPRFNRTVASLLAFAILALAAAGLALYRSRVSSGSSAMPIRSIAVLPLRNLTGDPAQEYFSDGISESLITELSRIDGLKVISRASAFTFKNKEVDAREIGRRLGVATVLEGSLRKNKDRIRVELRLVDTEDGRVLWVGDTYDRPLIDIFAVQDEIGCGVATSLKTILCGEEPRQIASRYTENVEAYQAYLKGRYFFFNHYSQMGPVESLKRARQYFEQAIAIDPNYALAYAGLANCHTQMMWYGPTQPRTAIASAKAAALKALEIDETLVEAYVALACAYCYDMDFQRAEEANRRAIEINPGYAPARHEYAIYLLFMGRAEEAMAEIRRAEELDPLNLIIMGDLGQVLYFTGRYDESINQFRKLLELNAGCSTNINIGMAYLQKGMHKKAIDEFQEDIKCRGRSFETVASLACAYAVAGRSAEARALLNELTDLSKRKYLPKVFFAYIYAALGEKERAFEMLEKAYSDRDINLLNMKNHPWLDPLRPDARFRDLLNRVGLPG